MLIPLALALCLQQKVAQGPVVLISWDGASNEVVQRLLKEGKLPNVRRLTQHGWIAEGSVSCWPSKTAAAHMVAYTGCLPGKNGVASNSVPILPRAQHTILESQTAFDSRVHAVPPIWTYAANQGKKVLVLSAWGSYPPAPDSNRLKPNAVKNLVTFSGFEATIEKAGVLSGTGGSQNSCPVGEEKLLAKPDRHGVWATVGNQRHFVPPSQPGDLRGWSTPFRVRKGKLVGFMRLRLVRFDSRTGDFDLYHSKASGMQGTETQDANLRYLEAYGAFHDDAFRLYDSGGLGKTAFQGGNGDAEMLALEIVRQDCQFLKKSFRFGLSSYHPDLILHYSPMVDSCGHTLMGALDPSSGTYKTSMARKVRPLYEGCCEALDDWLGDMMQAAGPNANFCLMSDHGMAGVSRYVAVNRILADAGLAAIDAQGNIDLSRTKICVPSAGDFLLYVNGRDWKNGIVEPGQKSGIIEAARQALMSFRDPATGKRVVRQVLYGSEAAHRGLVGPTCGDAYLDFEPDYYPTDSNRAEAIYAAGTDHGAGVHGFDPTRPSMLATLVMGGPWISKKGQVRRQYHTDIFPTLCVLLGVPIPAELDGKLIPGALAKS